MWVAFWFNLLTLYYILYNIYLNTLICNYCFFLPNDHVVFVDDASQGTVFNGKAIAYDYTGSAFKAVEK